MKALTLDRFIIASTVNGGRTWTKESSQFFNTQDAEQALKNAISAGDLPDDESARVIGLEEFSRGSALASRWLNDTRKPNVRHSARGFRDYAELDQIDVWLRRRVIEAGGGPR